MSIKRKFQVLQRKLGAGLITGASDDDPSGIATYSQAGANFGFSTLWSALLTYPLMFAIQEMSARIGIATSKGLASVIAEHYSKAISYMMLILMFPSLVINIAANLSGMSAVAVLLIPFISLKVFSSFFAASILIGFLFSSYKRIISVFKYLCLILILYLFVPFFVHVDWKQVAFATFIPEIKWDEKYLMILVAILGTTISPYLFFWQASLCVEEEKHEIKTKSKKMEDMKFDVNAGMLFSNLIMYFIILTTGAVLNSAGITQIETVDQAAKALEPIAGEWAYLFFSIGVLASGFLAIPVLAGCAGFIFAETFKWKRGLDLQPKEAKKFYAVVTMAVLLAWAINLIGIDPMDALLFAAVLYGMIAPFIIGLILMICNNKEIMKKHVNGWRSNLAGFFTLLLMTIAAVALLVHTLNLSH